MRRKRCTHPAHPQIDREQIQSAIQHSQRLLLHLVNSHIAIHILFLHLIGAVPDTDRIENIDQAKEALDAFMAENDKEPRLILVQGVGAFIMEDDKGKAAKAQLLAKDAIKLAVYAESFGGPLQMTDEITYFITHWEAEAYRSKK